MSFPLRVHFGDGSLAIGGSMSSDRILEKQFEADLQRSPNPGG